MGFGIWDFRLEVDTRQAGADEGEGVEGFGAMRSAADACDVTGRGADAQSEEGVCGVSRMGQRRAQGGGEVRGVVRSDDEDVRDGVVRRRGLPTDGVDEKFHAVGQTAYASGTYGDARRVCGQPVHELTEGGFGDGEMAGYGGWENG